MSGKFLISIIWGIWTVGQVNEVKVVKHVAPSCKYLKWIHRQFWTILYAITQIILFYISCYVKILLQVTKIQ